MIIFSHIKKGIFLHRKKEMERDKLIHETNGHKIMRDKRQFVVWHPAGCKHRGSVYDRHKTFHGWWMVEDFIADCGLELPAQVKTRINAISDELRDKVKGYWKC